MAEYWKSTPRYWCKFCSTYIRDTGLERRNHESTARHQSALQRNLRQLHSETARRDRERDSARNEVARLNGVISGTPGSHSKDKVSGGGGENGTGPAAEKGVGSRGTRERQATVEERKQQLAQLAAMGVAVPESYRKEAAMAGEWETVAVRPVRPVREQTEGVKKEEAEEKANVKTEAKAVGVRKRKANGDDENDEDGLEDAERRKPWGSRVRKFPGGNRNEEEDIEALLGGGKKVKVEQEVGDASANTEVPRTEESEPLVKKEDEELVTVGLPEAASEGAVGLPVAKDSKEEVPGEGIVFKKRKKAVPPK